MVRLIFVTLALLCICPPTNGGELDAIKPGSDLIAAKAILRKHGFDADSANSQLAMVAPNQNHMLDFCKLDEHSTLVCEYQRASKKLLSVAIVIIPDSEPKSKRCSYQINVQEIRFEEDGAFWLKLKRDSKH